MRGPLCRPCVESLEDRLAPSTLDLLPAASESTLASAVPAVVQTLDASVVRVADVVHDVLDRAADSVRQTPVGLEVSAAVANLHAELRAEPGHGNGVGIGVKLDADHPEEESASAPSTPVALVVSAPASRSAALGATIAADLAAHAVTATAVVKTHRTAATATVTRVIVDASESSTHASALAADAPMVVGAVPSGDAPRLADASGPVTFASGPGQPWLTAAPDNSGRLGDWLFGGSIGAAGLVGLEEAGDALEPEPMGRIEFPIPENDIAAAEPASPAVEPYGPLSDAAPLNLAAMETALRQFLEQLDELGRQAGGWLADVGPLPWLLMGLAVAAALHEGVRRRLRQVRAENARRWFPGLNGAGEEA